MEYSLKKIADRIYLVEFRKTYELAMFFCRYQEFYESPNPNFKGKSFDLYEFMAWYANEYGNGVFTYPSDWVGYNLPSHIIDNVWAMGIPSKTQYDYEMLLLHRKLKEEAGSDYALIGTSKANRSDLDTIAHEIAHALFYTVPTYKEEMSYLACRLDKKLSKKMCLWLENIGYSEEVFVDEIQAYISTGITPSSKIDLPKEVFKPFYKTFCSYTDNISALKGWSRPK
jgi:hypothetical protein